MENNHNSSDNLRANNHDIGNASSTNTNNNPNRRKKHIDWDRTREEQLVNLVMKFKAHKRTNLTMEEKWSKVSDDLFTLEPFKDFVQLDGYTLQRKFTRMKRKVANKYEIESANFDLNSMPLYADELDRTVAKLVLEEIAEKQANNNHKTREQNRKISFRREMDEIVEELGHDSRAQDHSLLMEGDHDGRIMDLTEHPTYDSGSEQPRKRTRLAAIDSDSEEEDRREAMMATINHHAAIPSNQMEQPSSLLAYDSNLHLTREGPHSSSIPIQRPDECEEERGDRNNTSSSSLMDADRDLMFSLRQQDILSDSHMNSFGTFYNSKAAKFDLEFEKEKERRRLVHLERLEMLKVEYVMKQNLLKLEAEAKQAEAQIKLADAHKAQAEVTQALLRELQRLRNIPS